jgi:hypothetical protein
MPKKKKAEDFLINYLAKYFFISQNLCSKSRLKLSFQHKKLLIIIYTCEKNVDKTKNNELYLLSYFLDTYLLNLKTIFFFSFFESISSSFNNLGYMFSDSQRF